MRVGEKFTAVIPANSPSLMEKFVNGKMIPIDMDNQESDSDSMDFF